MYLILLTLLTQCYMPFIWKVCSIRHYDSRGILLVNYIVTVIISAALAFNQNLFTVLQFLPACDITTIMTEKSLPNTAWIVIVIGIAAGMVYYISLFFSQKNISVNGMGISSFFTQTGLVGSLIIAYLFFDETITVFQWLSIAGIMLSILLLTSDNQKVKIRSPLLLAAVCVFNIAVGVSNKFYAKYAIESYKTAFLTIAFFAAFIAAGIKIFHDTHRAGKAVTFGGAELVCGISLGAANLLYSYLNLRCLESFPAAMVVPTLSAGGLILSTLLAIFLFRESTSKKHVLAIILACLFIYFLNT